MASINEVFEYLPPAWCNPERKIALLKQRLENLERELPLKLAGNGVTKFFGDAQSLDELNKMEVAAMNEADAIRGVFLAQYDVFAALAEEESRLAAAKEPPPRSLKS